ncbi:hypothetical protein N7474_000069 [Penicillium riverlandense]|uniref:uncharacterized protein n=1 Tax=Penicillium riverlandense TaxID=1903569 RepID=UPI002548927B|nr:uncharacterized protein N7474_000069 [Penicillium riverlandense]KAJ5831758.1 hypothetical protein N7474_000069 [Penicillium riverlandense]
MAADAGRKSLRDLVFKQSGFLVNPLQWTARHLDLVGCRFEDADPAPVPAPTHTESTQDETRNNGGSGPVKKPRSDAEIMSMNLAPVIKRCHLANILEGEERAFTSHRYDLGERLIDS